MNTNAKTTFFSAIILACMVQIITGQNRISFQNLNPYYSINESTLVENDVPFVLFSVTSNNPTQSVLSVTCTSFSPLDSCDTFKIRAISASNNNWRGFIYLAKELDFSKIARYTFQLNATDGQEIQRQVLTIDVLATRNRPPTFVMQYSIEIPERPAASNDVILKIEAKAPGGVPANFPIRYRILSGQSSSYFNLNEISGDLTNIQPLKSSDPIFNDGFTVLQIEAAYLIGNVPSWGNTRTSSVTNATIYISGINSYAPSFDKPSYVGSVKETALPGTFVDSIFLTVTDLDKTPTAASFELFLDKETDKFDVNPKTGFKVTEARISVLNNDNFSYNDGPRLYSFNVIARETGSAEKKFSQASITVNLVQVNRYAPTFFQNPYEVTISELAPVGTTVVQVKAWDRDIGPIFGNESIRYRISQGPASLFRMTELGLITVAPCRTPGKYPCLDYETQEFRSLRLVVFAMDILGEGLTSSATVIINLNNENDNPPVFSQSSYRGLIEDNSTILTISPSPIQASDADGDPIVFSIIDGDFKKLWKIDPSTGVLTPIKPILYTDAPLNGIFNLVIQASDGPHNTLVNVNITVKPINRYTPTFAMNTFNVTISRTTIPGITITTLVVTDQDPPTTPGGMISCRIIDGDQDVFSINQTTCAITLKTPLNQGSPKTYILKVEASDQGETPKTSTAEVVINIISTSLFIPSKDTIIKDDLSPNSIVTNMTATTTVENPVFQYIFIDPIEGLDNNMNKIQNFTNDDKMMFRIDPSSGVIRVNQPLNSERVPVWRSVVQVTVMSNPSLTATGTITIRMVPANKRPPIFNTPWTPNSPFYILRIEQGNITRSDVATYSAISPNQSLTITYQLIDPQNYFALIADTSGIIRQIKPIMDLSKNYSFLLIAKDNGNPPLNSSAVINVLVNPNNLYPPEFDQNVYATSIFENATTGSSVIQVHATDRDSGDYGKIVYSIDPSVNSLFSINTADGLITVTPGAKFDAAKRPYIEFYVSASDSPLNLSKSISSSAFVNVTILDTNDHAPVFRLPDYRIQILDNFPVNSVIISVEATDGDLGINGQIDYAIVSGNNQDLFTIAPNGGISLKQSLTDKANTYILNVSATDRGIPSKAGYCNVYITVISNCGSRCNPVWLDPKSLSTIINIPESTALSTAIFVMAANNYMNKNSSINFTFLDSGNKSIIYKNFKINKTSTNTATITILEQLNYGKIRSYTFQVEASDVNIPGSSNIIYVTINVQPSFNPQFPYDKQTNCTLPITVEVPITTPRNAFIATVTADSRYPNDQVTYSIRNVTDLFMIRRETGEIYITQTLNKITSYILIVNANYSTFAQQTTFLCQNSDQSTVTIFIVVKDVIPTYSNSSINFCIDNSLEADSNVLQINSFLINDYFGEVVYTSTETVDLLLMSNGYVNLKKAASDIKVPSLSLPVESRYLLNPSSVAKINVVGHLVNRMTDLTLVTLNEGLSDFVSTGKQQFLNTMGSYGYVCFVDATYHSTEQGTFDTSMTDVFMYIINSVDGKPILPLTLDHTFNTVAQRSSANIVGITYAVSKWDGFNYNPVAIAIGLIMGLLLLCLLFFCLCCLWPFIAACCMSSAEKEPFLTRSMAGGIVGKEWAINPQFQEQEQQLSLEVPGDDYGTNGNLRLGQDFGDGDILQEESFRSAFRREDNATVDGMMSNESLQPVVPAGYVHIEAPLAPSRNASAMEVSDVVRSGNAFQSVSETTLQESYERGISEGRRSTYLNQEDMNIQSTRSRSRRDDMQEFADDIEEGPVQLNDASNAGSQIGATLIKAEPIGGLTQVQSIISGNEPAFDNGQGNLGALNYSNYSGTIGADPSRSNMAYSNEVVFSALRPASLYDDRSSTLLNQPYGDLTMNPINGGSRQDLNFMERFEETRFL